MYQSFIHIENDQLFLALLSWWWEVDNQILHFFSFYNPYVILNKLQGLHRLHKMLLMEVLLLTWLPFLILLRHLRYKGIKCIASIPRSIIIHQHWIPLCCFDADFSFF